MRSHFLLAFAAAIGLVSHNVSTADEVRYYEKDGVTYKETRRVVREPISETRLEQKQQTVYREQYRTEMKDSQRTVYQPVTEYRWQAYLHGRWNPLVQPYWAYRLVPSTRWVARQETVRMPVTQRELVPETRTVQVPITTQRVAEREIIERVAVSASPSGAQTAQSGRPLGGVARLESDPPRDSTTLGSGTQLR